MVLSTRTAGVAAGLMSLGLLVGTNPALAAKGPGTRPAPITGTVNTVSGTSLQVQTATGPTTVTLTAHTRVEKVAKGSVADLAPNQHVSLHLVSGTSTVDAVQIDLTTRTKPTTTTTKHPTKTWTGTRPTGTHPAGTHPIHTGTPSHVEGQVTGVQGTSVTISGRKGQPATYTLSPSVTVTKVTSGTIADLTAGQKVEVFSGASGAIEVTILVS